MSRTTFQDGFSMRFLETPPPREFPSTVLRKSLPMPCPQTLFSRTFPMRFPKIFPGMLSSSALPKTHFLDALPRTRKGDAPCGTSPFCCSVSAWRPDARHLFARRKRQADAGGNTGHLLKKVVPPSPGPPSSLPKLFIFGNTETGRPSNVKRSRGKTPLPNAALLIPPSVFSRRFTAGRQGTFFKIFF